ncbi:MAG: single-stranded DNA-binding protein [Actinomycetota bacterium]
MSVPITVAGNLTRDLDHRVTDGGRSVATTRIAVNRRIPDHDGGWRNDEPTFLNVTIWGPLADHAAESVRKGDRVIASGDLREEQWTDQQGQQHSGLVLHADDLAVSLKWGVVTGFDKRTLGGAPVR